MARDKRILNPRVDLHYSKGSLETLEAGSLFLFFGKHGDRNKCLLADRTRYFKNDEEEVGIMCRLLEDMRMEAMEEDRIEGKREGVLNTVWCLIADGTLPLEKIAAFAGLPYEEVKAVADSK